MTTLHCLIGQVGQREEHILMCWKKYYIIVCIMFSCFSDLIKGVHLFTIKNKQGFILQTWLVGLTLTSHIIVAQKFLLTTVSIVVGFAVFHLLVLFIYLKNILRKPNYLIWRLWSCYTATHKAWRFYLRKNLHLFIPFVTGLSQIVSYVFKQQPWCMRRTSECQSIFSYHSQEAFKWQIDSEF